MAFTNRGELVSIALDIVREAAVSTTFEASKASAYALVDSALDWFSRFSPRELRATWPGDGVEYQFELPTDWRQDFSAVLRVEYPVQQSRAFIAPDRWSLYPTPNGATHLALGSGLMPTATQTVGLDYIAPHYVTDEASTVTTHQGVVQLLLAVLIARLQASRTGYTTDPAIEADAVNYRGKGGEWAAIAKNLLDTASASFGQDLSLPSRGGSRFSRSWGL